MIKLNDCKIILASKSPRREKLLGQIGLEFEVIPSEFDEDSIGYANNPEDYVKLLSFKKAESVAKRINYNALIIGADTIVVLENEILGKPLNEHEAFITLKKLSNKTHLVFTGMTVINNVNNRTLIDYKKTEVSFRELSDEEIWSYIKTGSPMDKAGAYGIQDDYGAVFVNHIVGCYYNIVGLPLEKLYSMLLEAIC